MADSLEHIKLAYSSWFFHETTIESLARVGLPLVRSYKKFERIWIQKYKLQDCWNLGRLFSIHGITSPSRGGRGGFTHFFQKYSHNHLVRDKLHLFHPKSY